MGIDLKAEGTEDHMRKNQRPRRGSGMEDLVLRASCPTTVKNQEWLKQVASILEMLNEGVTISDDSGRILFVNRRMERLIGTPRSELIGKTADAFYSGEDYDFTLARMATIKGAGYDRYEFFVPRANGKCVPVILSSRQIEAPDGSHFTVVTCTDITEQKRAEHDLREANLELARHAEEIERELALASRVQASLAPSPLHWGRLAVETYYNPVRTIGGDFGLVAPYDGTHLDLFVCGRTFSSLPPLLCSRSPSACFDFTNRWNRHSLGTFRRCVHVWPAAEFASRRLRHLPYRNNMPMFLPRT